MMARAADYSDFAFGDDVYLEALHVVHSALVLCACACPYMILLVAFGRRRKTAQQLTRIRKSLTTRAATFYYSHKSFPSLLIWRLGLILLHRSNFSLLSFFFFFIIHNRQFL